MIDVICTNEKERLRSKLERIRERNVALDVELLARVQTIIDDVRGRGDEALIVYAGRFDGLAMEPSELRINRQSLLENASRVDPPVLEALREAINRVRWFHEHEREFSWDFDVPDGGRLGQRVTPIESAGVYVPGGSAAYPSSVVMNIVPALVAGVERIVVATPPQTIQQNPTVAAALIELNVNEVYAVGGPQAIAALAFGTETVPRVDKITGPGNRYVTAAKKLVFGVVGIDSLAGASEVVVIADESARASFIASDLLAQSEHSEDTSAILLTTSRQLASEVLSELGRQMHKLPRAAVTEKALTDNGAIIVVASMDEACELGNELAPEHLQVMTHDEDAVAAKIRNAGAVFLGEQTPAAVGDYFAGPNHVLPTSGAARFSSALSVRDFIKRTSVVKFSAREMKRTAPMIAALARAEGFDAHARSVLMRAEENS